MPTNRKRIPHSRKDSGLTGAEELFVFGKTDKPANKFEMLDLEYPGKDKVARRDTLLKMKKELCR